MNPNVHEDLSDYFQQQIRSKDILPISRFPNSNQSNQNLQRLYIWGVVRCLFVVFSVVRLDQGCQNQQAMLQGWPNNQSKNRTVLISRQQTVYRRQQTIRSRQQKIDSRQQTVKSRQLTKCLQSKNISKTEMSSKLKCL